MIVGTLYTKVWENGHTHSVGFLLAIGVRYDGHRETFVFHIADS